MKKNSFDLSDRIDPGLLEVAEVLIQVTDPLSIPFFLIGAACRDLILDTIYGINTIRATSDIDFAICISDWDQFVKLKKELILSEMFEETRLTHRLIFKSELLIDLVPFGPITGRDKKFSWPSEPGLIMNTLGFEEAYEHSIPIIIRSDPLLKIQIASLAGLVVTKLFSWKDKYPDRARDAQDIILIVKEYTYAGNDMRMFNEAPDLVEKEDFDYELAGARLLGRDIGAFIDNETKNEVLKILEDETGDQQQYPLIEQMTAEIDFEHKLKMIEELKAGIKDSI